MTVRRALTACLLAAAISPAAAAAEPDPRTPIRHFITLMQENHSFDNYFGTYPGADGIPPGTCVPTLIEYQGRRCVEPFPIRNRAIVDLGHTNQVFRKQYNGGRMDGFVKAFRDEGLPPDSARLAVGYYDGRDIPFYWNVADEYVLFDRFFTSSRGGSLANHMFWVAGQAGAPDLRHDRVPEGGYRGIPTIFDRLQEAGVSWKFYVQNYDPHVNLRNRGKGDRASQTVWVPILNFPRFLDDPRLFSRIVDLSEYYRDLERGTLPSVAFMVPSGSSEHPPGSIRAGERFVRSLVTSLMKSESWDSSAILWTYDDWGGFYDHVRPPTVDRFGYGFRAPTLLVSPYAKRGHIEHETLDFTSILKFIEENWGLEPLARRDRRAKSIAGAFDFSQPPRPAQLLAAARVPPKVDRLNRTPVYLIYAAALGLTALLVAWAGWRVRPAARRSATVVAATTGHSGGGRR